MQENKTQLEKITKQLVDQDVTKVGIIGKKDAKKKNIYRLALYGVRGSGKTCILAALSLPRVAHPLGYTCTWIQEVPGHEFPAGPVANWKTSDPFLLGYKWLIEQRESLKAGDTPPPNKTSQDTMRFLFNFSSKDFGRRQIELIDYSGELLTANSSELANNLRGIMKDCDGLLVLAEVPYPGRDQISDAENLEKLKCAFSVLLEERESGPKVDWPIGLLFNKWDRRTNFRDFNADSGEIAIKAFLAESPQPAQVPLVDMLKNLVGEENLHCLPISAFGAHKIRGDGAEVPETQGALLESFNLEDGFVWVAQRVDALKVKRLEEASENASWWAFQQLFIGVHPDTNTSGSSAFTHWFRGVSTLKGVSAAGKLMRSLPSGTDLHKQVWNKYVKFSLQAGTQILTAFITYLIAEALFEGSKYREIVATQSNPGANQGQLERGEEWLEAYVVSHPYRNVFSSFFVVTRPKANIQLADFRKRRDESAWIAIKDTEDFQAKIELAKKYEKNFPNGFYIKEIIPLIAEYFMKIKKRENEDYLAGVANKISAFPEDEKAPLEALQSLFDSITKLPNPDLIDKDLSEKQGKLKVILNEKQAKIVAAGAKMNWETFKYSYIKLMESGNIAGAANKLETRTPKDENLKILVEDFIEKTPSIIKEKVKNALKFKLWQGAREAVKVKTDTYVMQILTQEQLKDIQKFAIEIDEAEDFHLYSQIIDLKPSCSDQVDAYLLRAPLKTMKKEVEEYQKYIAMKKNTLDLTIILQEIRWHADFWSYDRYLLPLPIHYKYDNNIVVSIKGVVRINPTTIRSTPNQRSANLGSCTLKAPLNESITIHVKNVTTYGKYLTDTIPGGEGSWTGTPNQLSSGITVDLKGVGFTNEATFLLKGLPTEPELPAWRK